MPDSSAEFMSRLKMIGIHMQTLLPHSEETLAKRIPPFKEKFGFFSQSHFKWLPQPHKENYMEEKYLIFSCNLAGWNVET